MKKYLVIIPNSDSKNNILINASDYDNAIDKVRKLIIKGTKYQTLKIVELDTSVSKQIFIE